ncbi:MAG: nucleoside hydrolase [Burkholderiales bacterium]|nr:nucleoside hydrolase [Burkholderiales bacterium]
MTANATTREIWLDTDPGFDDWLAWALLEADPGFTVRGASVVAGNAPLPVVLANARRIHALHGWKTPIWAGADQPLVQPQVTAQDVLGTQGMHTSGAALPDTESALQRGHGVDAMIDCVRAHPGRITLLAIGPLTNVALAFAKAPELPGLLAGLVIMGGSLGAGNTTPVAEFNIHADPEAASQVFARAREVPGGTRLFGIEVCRQVQGGDAHVAALREGGGRAARGSERAAILTDHFDGYVGMARRRGRATAPMYDLTPVAWLAHPEWFTLQPAHVDVELRGTLTRGMTVCELRVPQRATPNAEIAMTADGDRVMGWAVEVLRGAL